MLARLEAEVPAGGFLYEPKWDGFRCIVFRDGDDVELASRNERPLTRYFPELVAPIADAFPHRAVVDGEVVVAGPHGLNFDALLQRLHPAASRVRRLAAETPASFVAFDILGLDDEDLRPLPFEHRRRVLSTTLQAVAPPVYLTPSTDDRDVALDWFARFEGAGLDGVVAKAVDLPYREGERAMIKVKHGRTADCVVGGWRKHVHGGVGSLLLGLHDATGLLHRVGVCSAFSARRRKELLGELEPFALPPGQPHPWTRGAAGASEGDQAEGDEGEGASAASHSATPPSRWNRGRDTSWEPLVPVRVCEVAYDHLQGARFRHATTFRRWRPDRVPESCTFDQLDTPVPTELREIFALPH